MEKEALMELMELTELQQVLQDYAKDAAEIYKYQISLGGHNASRKLTDNVKANVVAGDKAYEVTLQLQEYWKYIEGGSKGLLDSPAGAVYPAHFPPPYILERWINIKPIIPRPRADGHIPSPRELSYLIGRKIRDHGIEPFPALEVTKENLEAIYKDKISAALGRDIGNYLRKIVTEK